MKCRLHVSLVLALGVVLASCGKPSSEGGGSTGATGKGEVVIPEGKGPIFENRQKLSLHDFRKKVVVVELGCVGCPKTDETYGALVDLYGDYSGKAEFIRVDFKQSLEDNKGYYEKTPPPFHVLGDPEGKIGMKLPSQAMPTLYLFGKWGQMRYGGIFEAEGFKSMMKALIAERKPDPKNYFLKKKGPEKGEDLIDFTLSDGGGLELTLSNYRSDSDAFVLVFSGTSCPTSRTAVKTLGRIAADLEDENIAFLVVNIGEVAQMVGSVYGPMGLPFPVLVDVSEKVANIYGIDAVPTIFITGPDGKVALRSLWNGKAVEQEIDILLGRKKETEREEIEQAGEG